ncbi:MAG TPA: M28 family peptidase [Polyangiaceae bacterium]
MAAPDPSQTAAPLSAEQQALRQELEAHVKHLSTQLGERSLGRAWELADAADYVATEWEQMGYTLVRQGYDVGEVVAQNLEVSVSGSDLGRESIIIGAHYDSPPAGTGVDAATGVAALLAVARALRDSSPRRRLRFVAYALGEPPHFRSESMGSLRHARQLAARGDAVTAMISLDSLGYFSDKPGSQRSISGIDVPLPQVGNFLLLLGSQSAASASRILSAGCDREPQLELVLRTYAGGGDPPLAADDWPYRESGLPALVVSDTKSLRSAGSGRSPASVDWPRFTRFVSCLTRGIERLAKPPEAGAGAEPIPGSN